MDTPFTPACRVRLAAFGWAKVQSGDWNRYLVRECQTCPKPHVTKLAWVDADYAVCLGCLGQMVVVDSTVAPFMVRCEECGARTEVALHELQEVVEFYDDDDDDEDLDEPEEREPWKR